MPMTDAASELLAHCGLFALLSLFGIALARGRANYGWLAIAFALFLLQDFALTGGWGYLPRFDPVAGPWPWEGQLAVLATFLVAGLLVFRADRAAFGFTFAQGGPAPLRGWIAAVLILSLFAFGAWRFVPGSYGQGVLDYAYHATLPGLSEELFYRGVLLAALDRAFTGRLSVAGVPLGWGAVMTTLFFASAHTLGMTPQYLMSLEINAAAYYLLAGGVLVWLRAATGSLLAPVLVHNWALLAFYLL